MEIDFASAALDSEFYMLLRPFAEIFPSRYILLQTGPVPEPGKCISQHLIKRGIQISRDKVGILFKEF